MHANEAPVTQPGTVLPIWAWAGAVLAVALFWAVMMEAGVLSEAAGQSGPFLHELFHDARHLVGVPCH